MNELLPMITERDGIPVTTSRAVAEQFGKNHAHVIRAIEDLKATLDETEDGKAFNRSNFGSVEYRDAKGESRPMYLLTRDGFTLLAMGFTGPKALQFKIAYINAFDRMENIIKRGISSERLQLLEDRLQALEAATAAGKEDAEETIAGSFLKAIEAAVAGGKYVLIPKRARDRKEPLQGEILGVYDEFVIILKAQLAYKEYKAAADNPLDIRSLWQILERTGTIRKRTYKTRTVGDKKCAAVSVYRDKGKALVPHAVQSTDTRA